MDFEQILESACFRVRAAFLPCISPPIETILVLLNISFLLERLQVTSKRRQESQLESALVIQKPTSLSHG